MDCKRIGRSIAGVRTAVFAIKTPVPSSRRTTLGLARSVKKPAADAV